MRLAHRINATLLRFFDESQDVGDGGAGFVMFVVVRLSCTQCGWS